MALNFEYVVYESCQLADLTIKKCKQNFFVENFQVLANFLSKRNCYRYFFDKHKSVRLISIMLHFFKKLHFPSKNMPIRKDFGTPDEGII